MKTKVKTGQIWRDNDPRLGGRLIKVLGVVINDEMAIAMIASCDGNGTVHGPRTRTKLERFGKKGRIGFTLVKGVDGQVNDPLNDDLYDGNDQQIADLKDLIHKHETAIHRAIEALRCEGEFAHLSKRSSGEQIDAAHDILRDTMKGRP